VCVCVCVCVCKSVGRTFIPLKVKPHFPPMHIYQRPMANKKL